MSINRLNTNIDKNEETNLRIYFSFPKEANKL